MPRIQYPNVPNVAGVPQLLRRLPSAPPTVVATIAGLGSLARAFLSKNVWGVFEHLDPVPAAPQVPGGPTSLPGPPPSIGKRVSVLTPDSFLDFDYNQEWSVSTAPTQKGGFTDYNRVASPFEIKLRMFKGGGIHLDSQAFTSLSGLKNALDPVQERKAFLQQIEDLSTTKLYDVVTPEKTYFRCNFTRAEISRRGEKGAYQLSMVDVYFREIREVIPTYTKTVIKAPADVSASQQQNNGTQQGLPVTTTPPLSVTQ